MKTPYPSFGTGPFFKISPSDILSARCADRVLRDDPPHTSSGPRSPARTATHRSDEDFPLKLDGLYPRSSPDVVGAPAMLSDVRVFPHHLGPSMTVAKSIRSLPDTCRLCMACLPTPLCWIAVDHCNFWQIPISILGKFRCEFLANSNVNSWKIPLLVRRGQSPALIVSASPETSSSVIPMVGK